MPRSADRDLRPHGIADRRRALEVVAVTLLILIFVAVITHKVWSLRAVAERIAVEHMISTLRTALAIKIVEGIARGNGPAAIAVLGRSNPVLLLDRVPPNYLGELSDAEAGRASGYSWFFDAAEGMLVYRVAADGLLATDLPGPPRIRWRIGGAFDDQNEDGQFDEAMDRMQSIDLRPVEPYRWNELEE